MPTRRTLGKKARFGLANQRTFIEAQDADAGDRKKQHRQIRRQKKRADTGQAAKAAAISIGASL